jgi:FlaA1/EpsC-like NDP-sugar epimerase
MKLNSFYKGLKVAITGAAGDIGRELASQILSFKPSELRLLDNNESEMFFLLESYRDRENVSCLLGDVRDRDRLFQLSKGADVLIHCAAYKHVTLSEYNPFDVVQTNVMGVENVVRAAKENGVKYVLFTSSDKAVNPTNVMGSTKLVGEKLMTAANTLRTGTILSSTRFGNVIGSRGSVVPLFRKQIRAGGPVTLTDRQMTRFMMTLEESTRLVLRSVTLSRGGEVFVTKMPVATIADLAEIMIEILAPRYGYKPSDIETVEIGARPGEKLYEELLSDEEAPRTIELKDVFVIPPALRLAYGSIRYEYPGVVSGKEVKTYKSSTEKPFSKRALKKYLLDNNVLDFPGDTV